MSRIFFTIFLALSLLLSGCGSSYLEHEPAKPAVQQTIKWQKYSETALVVSKTSKRPALIYFHLEGCPGCKLMDSLTLSHPEVAYYVMNNYVPIKVDASNDKLLDKYGIDRFPTFVILLSDSLHTPIVKLPGVGNKEDMLSVLKQAAEMNKLITNIDVLEDFLDLE